MLHTEIGVTYGYIQIAYRLHSIDYIQISYRTHTATYRTQGQTTYQTSVGGGGMFIREKGSLWSYTQNTYGYIQSHTDYIWLHTITYRFTYSINIYI